MGQSIFPLAKRPVTEGVGAASIMELLSLELPFSVLCSQNKPRALQVRALHVSVLSQEQHGPVQASAQFGNPEMTERGVVCGWWIRRGCELYFSLMMWG